MSKRGCLCCVATLAVVLVLVAVSVAWYGESRYQAVFRAPKVKHETYATAGTALKIVVRPPLEQRRIAQWLLPERRLPDWVLSAVVPEEAALLVDPDLEDGTVDLRLFLNYARLEPVLRRALDDLSIPARLPGIEWSTPKVVNREQGVLLLEGTAPIPPSVIQGVSDAWVGTPAYPAPVVEGGHVVEAAIENRNGKGFAAVAALAALAQGNPRDFKLPFEAASFRLVSAVNVRVDLETDDVLKLHVVIEGSRDASATPAAGIKQAVEIGVYVAKGSLKTEYGIELEGGSVIDGDRVICNYTLTGVEQLIKASLGA